MMSVLRCGRRGCENIMCDRYSYEHGYLCSECFEELVSTGPETDINYFMESLKRPNRDDESTARYGAVFELRETLPYLSG